MIRSPLFALLLVLAAALSGCAAEPDAPAAPASDTALPANNTTTVAPAAPVVLGIDPVAPTQGDRLALTGRVDQPARLLVTQADGEAGAATLVPAVEVAAGAWSLQVPLAPGRTNLTVTADTGRATAQATVQAVRLVAATFEARFTAAFPPHAPIQDEVWYDPDGRASAPLYADVDAEHPPYANVHDLMVTWTQQSGKAIEYDYFDGLGFSPSRIDGVGQPLTSSAPPYWCYQVNGETVDFGITLQPVQEGDVVTWEYGACA